MYPKRMRYTQKGTYGTSYRRMNVGQPNVTNPVTPTPTGAQEKHHEDAAALVLPHTATNKQPQIHDSSVQASNGISIRDVAQLQLKPGYTYTLCIYPGINSMWCITDQGLDYTGGGFTATKSQTARFHEYHGALNVDVDTLADDESTANAEQTLQNNYNINRWRLVSQGVHIQLMNSDRDNSGWWESCTMPMPIDTENYIIQNDQKVFDELPFNDLVPQAGDWTVSPDLTLINSTTSIANEPSYCRGALKDIHKQIFNVKKLTDEHPWIPFGNQRRWKNTFLWQRSSYGASKAFKGQSGTAPEVYPNTIFPLTDIGTMVYTDAKMTLVRIHCIKHEANLIIDTAQNVEVVYDTGNKLRDYAVPHVIGAKAEAFESVQKLLNDNHWSAQDLYGSKQNLEGVWNYLRYTEMARDNAKAVVRIGENVLTAAAAAKMTMDMLKTSWQIVQSP